MPRFRSLPHFALSLLVAMACTPAMAEQVRRPVVAIPPSPPTTPQQTMGAQTDAEKPTMLHCWVQLRNMSRTALTVFRSSPHIASA